jgi:hypothetical protein
MLEGERRSKTNLGQLILYLVFLMELLHVSVSHIYHTGMSLVWETIDKAANNKCNLLKYTLA